MEEEAREPDLRWSEAFRVRKWHKPWDERSLRDSEETDLAEGTSWGGKGRHVR